MANLILTSDYNSFHWRVTGLSSPFNTTYYTYVGIASAPVQYQQPFPPSGLMAARQATSNYNYTYTTTYTQNVSPGVYHLYAFTVDTQNRCYPINANPESVTVYSAPTYSVTLSCGTGVSAFTTNISQVGTITSQTTKSGVSAGTYTIATVTPKAGYTEPYIMYYNIASQPGSYAGSKEFTIGNGNTFSVTDYDRLIQIAATPEPEYYYYKCSVHIDGYATTTQLIETTSKNVLISELKATYAPNYIVTEVEANGYTVNPGVDSVSIYSSRNNPSNYTQFDLYCIHAAVTPTIQYVSASPTTITVKWGKNGGTEGRWYILYDTAPTTWSSNYQSPHVEVTSPGNFTITGLNYKSGYYISCVNMSGTTVMQSDDIYVDRGGGGGGGGGGRTIQPFAWTANDDQYIRAGQPITNLKASAWNSLLDKMAEVCNVNGQIIADINGQWAGKLRVSSGEAVGKIKFNALVSDLAQMYGTGNVVDPVGDGYQVIKATYFANDLKYFEDIKSAINRAINAINT